MEFEFKTKLVYTLLHRCFTIASGLSKFHFETETLKTVFTKKFTQKCFDKCISKFLSNVFLQKPVINSVLN